MIQPHERCPLCVLEDEIAACAKAMHCPRSRWTNYGWLSLNMPKDHPDYPRAAKLVDELLQFIK